MQVSSVFGSKAVGDEMLPCVSLLHPHGQASLLRSHAGGLSVVATTECMLYAASEVSAILRKASVALHPHSHTPFPNTTLHRSTFPPPALYAISYRAGTLSSVLVFYCPQALIHIMQISHESHSTTPCCLVRTQYSLTLAGKRQDTTEETSPN